MSTGQLPIQPCGTLTRSAGHPGNSAYARLKTSWLASGQIMLYAPNGTLLASPMGGNGVDVTQILPVTGTYTLLVGDANGDETGTYDLYLQRTNNPANPVLISYSNYVNGTIAHPALWNTYTFSGTSGGFSVCPVEDQLVGLWTNHALCPERNPAGITHGRKWG